MNPFQKNKVDINVSVIYAMEQRGCSLTPDEQSLNEEEQKLFRLYGKLPNKKDLLQNKLKVLSHLNCYFFPSIC